MFSDAHSRIIHPYSTSRILSPLCFQGSSSVNDGASEEALEQLRDSLKLGIKAAWSQEALRRGVAAAKVPLLAFLLLNV